MLKWLTEKLIERAKRTPYFHLDGYMLRWWLVPYNVVITRTLTQSRDTFHDEFGSVVGGFSIVTTDGTGMVSPWRRPLTWLIQKCGIAIRVHEILRSDAGRGPHNHPWPYLTIILKGGYWEKRYNADGSFIDEKWHGPGSILYRPANSWHRLDLPMAWVEKYDYEFQTCTTLFFTGKKVQRWGFLSPEGEFTPYDKYPGRNA